jgi:hypothetical protein
MTDPREGAEWPVIVEFLRRTDPQLLARLSRRMINHLCWTGVERAQAMLASYSSSARDRDDEALDDNRPLAHGAGSAIPTSASAIFALAAEHMTGGEILAAIEKWIRDDNSGFLIELLDHFSAEVNAIIQALDRFHQSGLDDSQLSRSTQIGLRASLARRLVTDDTDYINIAKNWLSVADYAELAHRVIATSGSHGKLGGKSAGLLLACAIVRKSPEHAAAIGEVRAPRTWYVVSDALLDFIGYNHLEDVHNRKYLEIDQIRRDYPHIVQVFKHSRFPPEIVQGLSLALDDLQDRPIIVRSSSLLEDRMGAAFSGKYKSLFLANRGTKRERLGALMDAVAEVYSSIFSPDPMEYRAERGLLDVHEEMAIMIQEVVGTRAGRYFLPAFAGVAFSNNEIRWSPRIRREDGLVRLVPGLGTRAVDRLADDYPVLVAPGQPSLRVNVSPEELLHYSPRKIDLINLETGRFDTMPVDMLLKECGRQLPSVPQIVSVLEPGGVPRPAGFDWDPARDRSIVTFDGLLQSTPFVPRLRTLLALLRDRIGGPVDIEFACDGRDFYLLQCRSQAYADDAAPATIPHDMPPERLLFTARRYVSNGRVGDITHVVYVDPEQYQALGTLAALREVGRAVGRLNAVLPKRHFVLIGPGRWGSRGDVRLGVSVTYSDISNAAMLLEVARQRGRYVPDVSFGTHFFQDLVESGIRYLPLYPDEPGVVFNEPFLCGSENLLPRLLPDHAQLAAVLRVIDVPRATGGLVLRVLMNADTSEVVGLFAHPS